MCGRVFNASGKVITKVLQWLAGAVKIMWPGSKADSSLWIKPTNLSVTSLFSKTVKNVIYMLQNHSTMINLTINKTQNFLILYLRLFQHLTDWGESLCSQSNGVLLSFSVHWRRQTDSRWGQLPSDTSLGLALGVSQAIQRLKLGLIILAM